ncbi:glutathione-disulfide reductase [Comamonas sp. Tr-654]|uniref:glutathione-disulfide reductase n=1 Tax=Comamonas sp. Tr-654 TaxID=2608341 RepID=UPI00141F0505|nr:glutathione-disulfide reductase [Comamonas sp. Tr-654]NIF84642.1 glutathione-disulfide reductase [Comamonas sp. Tr-654]
MQQQDFDYDFLVIGGGSGGVRASRVAAGLGARVAVVEAAQLGGTCVNVGCIPKKLLSHAAHFSQLAEEARGFGWQLEQPRFDWPALIANKDREIERLNGVYGRMLAGAGVTVIHGRAKLSGPHSVQVNGQTLHARHILIATGGTPSLPDIAGIEHAITSNEAFHLPQLPRRVVVVGGGYIAVEFASIFNGLGAETTLLHRRQQLLRGFDADLGLHLGQEMAQLGVTFRWEDEIQAIDKQADGLHLQLKSGEQLVVDCVMYATGRVPLIEGLGLDAAGVKVNDQGAIEVDQHFCSNVPSIHAVGDVVDRMALTPVALAEGSVVAHRLFGQGDKSAPDYELVPTAVFSHPQVGTVGLSEEAARVRFGAVQVFQSSFRPLTNRMGAEPENVFLKLIVSKADQRVRGVHMVGEGAGELMQGFAVALQCGATKQQFDATIGIHPTVAEELVTMREPVRE